jgi:hypothetical protein
LQYLLLVLMLQALGHLILLLLVAVGAQPPQHLLQQLPAM